MRRSLLVAVIALSFTTYSSAGWDDFTSKAKDLGKSAWESTKEFSEEAWEASKEWGSAALEQTQEWVEAGEAKLNEMMEPESPQEARKALDTMADVSLAKLFNQQPYTKALFDQAYGYAVFDSRKFSLLLHTNGGSGVAINRSNGDHIYMNMFGGGLALGFGAKFYQQVMLFFSKEEFDRFSSDGWENGWEGASDAGLVLWDESAELNAHVNSGTAVFVLNDKGLLLDANLSGSKYWRDGDLN